MAYDVELAVFEDGFRASMRGLGDYLFEVGGVVGTAGEITFVVFLY